MPLLIPEDILKPASVLLVHRRQWISVAIRWITRSRWNHAALIEGALHDDTIRTIEAMGNGVCHSTLEAYRGDPSVMGLAVYDVPTLTMEQRWRICLWAESMNGATYDTLQLLGIYARYRLPWLSRENNRLDDQDRMICSELIGRAYNSVSISLCPPGVGLGCLTPGDLVRTMTPTWEGWRNAVIPPKRRTHD